MRAFAFFLHRLCPLFLLLALHGPAALAAPAEDDPGAKPSSVPGYSVKALQDLALKVTKTGVGVNGIPALYRPQFVSVSDASLAMDDDEVVFIAQYPNGVTRIYPQRIMVWHEVVNDVLPDVVSGRAIIPGRAEAEGDSYCISYSPLTGTVVGFKAMAGRFPSTFGVSGDLLNANSVLYDRATQSRWSQLLAACIEGPMRGKRLERIPVLWAVWKGVKKQYVGKAEVLSRSTGFSRPYGRDPYGSYRHKGSYYDDVRLLFAVSRLDSRLPPKKRVLGLELDSLYGALQVDSVVEARVLNVTLGVVPLVGIHDAELNAVRVFDRRLDGKDNQALSFAVFEDNLIDEQTKSQWNALGQCTYGRLRGKSLAPVYAIDSMWFAWSAFHSDTDILPPLPWK